MIIDMDYKNEIGHLFQKYFSGTIMPDEQRLLDSWMREKEEYKQLFERLRKDTRFAEEYGIFREVDTTRAWEAFRVKNGLGQTTTDDYMDQVCSCNCITFTCCWGMAVAS